MSEKNLKKWVNIFENEEEFCSGELVKDLGIYIFESEMDKHTVKGKSLSSFYFKTECNKIAVYIDNKLDDAVKYDKIKEMFFRIINGKLQYEYFF